MSTNTETDFILSGIRGARQIYFLHIPSLCSSTLAIKHNSIAITHNKEFILVASATKLFIYSFKKRLLLETFTITGVTHLFIYQQKKCIAVSNTGKIVLANLPTDHQSLLIVFTQETENELSACTFDSSRQLLFCGYKNGNIQTFQLKNQKLVVFNFITLDTEWLTCLLYIPEPQLLLVGSWNHHLYLINDKGKVKRKITTQSSPLSLFQIPQTTMWGIGCYDGSITSFTPFELF